MTEFRQWLSKSGSVWIASVASLSRNDGETLSLLAARQSKAIASLIIHINKHTKADSRAWAFCCVFCFVDCHAANAARNDGIGALCEKVDSRIKLILGLNDSKHCGGAFGVFWGFGGRARLEVCGCLQIPKICGMPTQD